MSEATFVKGPEREGLSASASEDFVKGKRAAQTPEEVYALLRERFEAAAKVKWYIERQWVINLAHYVGQPHLGFDRRTGNLVNVPRESPWRVRVSSPIITYLVDTRIARIMRAVPEPMVLPASSSDDDRYKAKLAGKIVRYMLDKFAFKTKLSSTWLRHADVEGTGFLKVSFDPLGGDNLIAVPVEPPAGTEGEAALSPEGMPMQGEGMPSGEMPMQGGEGMMGAEQATPQEMEYVPEGDIKLEVVSPFEVFIDPSATSLEEARWLIQAKDVPISEAKRMFPKFAELVDKTSDNDQPNEFRAGTSNNILYDFPMFAAQWGSEYKDRVTLYEMWERSSLEYPTGRHIIVIGNKTVLDEMTPDEYNEIPYFDIQCLPVPNRYWAEPLVTLLVPLQLEYNRRRSQIMENLNAHAWLRMLVPNGSGVATVAKDAHYQINYDPMGAGGAKPEYMQIPSLPGEAFKQLADIKADMEEIAGVHDVSRGENPSTARTGKAIWFLQEADDTRLQMIVGQFHKAIADACTVMLKLVRTHYTAQRIAQVFVPHDVEVLEFVGSDLGENVRVVIDPRAKAPISLSQRIDLFTQLFELGAFVDPQTGVQDTKKFFGFLDLMSTDELFEEDSLHRMRARKEHLMVRQGQPPPPPQPYEDDNCHLIEHRRVTNTDEWFQWDESQRQMWFQHIQIHEFRQMKQAEMQGILPIGTTQQLQQGGEPLAAPEATGQVESSFEEKSESNETPEAGQKAKEPGVPNAPKTPTGTGQTSGEY